MRLEYLFVGIVAVYCLTGAVYNIISVIDFVIAQRRIEEMRRKLSNEIERQKP